MDVDKPLDGRGVVVGPHVEDDLEDVPHLHFVFREHLAGHRGELEELLVEGDVEDLLVQEGLKVDWAVVGVAREGVL